MTISAGELKHRIAIDVESNTSDGQGGFVTTWTTLGTHGQKLKTNLSPISLIAASQHIPKD